MTPPLENQKRKNPWDALIDKTARPQNPWDAAIDGASKPTSTWDTAIGTNIPPAPMFPASTGIDQFAMAGPRPEMMYGPPPTPPPMTPEQAADSRRMGAMLDIARQTPTAPVAQDIASRIGNVPAGGINGLTPDQQQNYADLQRNIGLMQMASRGAQMPQGVPPLSAAQGALVPTQPVRGTTLAEQGAAPLSPYQAIVAEGVMPTVRLMEVPARAAQYGLEKMGLPTGSIGTLAEGIPAMEQTLAETPSRSNFEAAGRLANRVAGEVGSFAVPGAVGRVAGKTAGVAANVLSPEIALAHGAGKVAQKIAPAISKVSPLAAKATEFALPLAGFTAPRAALNAIEGTVTPSEAAGETAAAGFNFLFDSVTKHIPGVATEMANFTKTLDPTAIDALKEHMTPLAFLSLPYVLKSNARGKEMVESLNTLKDSPEILDQRAKDIANDPILKPELDAIGERMKSSVERLEAERAEPAEQKPLVSDEQRATLQSEPVPEGTEVKAPEAQGEIANEGQIQSTVEQPKLERPAGQAEVAPEAAQEVRAAEVTPSPERGESLSSSSAPRSPLPSKEPFGVSTEEWDALARLTKEEPVVVQEGKPREAGEPIPQEPASGIQDVYPPGGVGEGRGDGIRGTEATTEATIPEVAPKEIKTPEQPPTDTIAGDRPPPSEAVEREPAKSEEPRYGLNKAEIETLRRDRGFQELSPPEKETFEQWLNDSKAQKLDESAMSTAQEVLARPRALNPEEQAGMVVKRVQLENQIKESSDLKDQLEKAGNTESAAIEEARLSTYLDQLDVLSRAADKAGTEWGQGGVARKMLLNRSYELATKLQQARKSKTSRLTAEERKNFEDISKQHEALKAEIVTLEDKHRKELEDLERQYAERLAKKEAARATVRKSATVARERIMKDREDIISKLKEMGLRGKNVTLNLNLNPEQLYQLGRLAKNYLEGGLNNIREVAKLIVAEFPDLTERDVYAAFNARDPSRKAAQRTETQKKLDSAKRMARRLEKVMNQADKALGGESFASGLRELANEIAERLVAEGVKDRDTLVDRTHAELKEMGVEVTREEASDAIAKYGETTELSKDQNATILRDLRGQLQQVAKIRDMESGIPPKKTGPERRIPSDEERSLIKRVNEAKRKYNLTATDPETQLKSALDAAKTTVKNSMADMQREIDAKEKTVKAKTFLKPDAELTELRRQRDELRKVHEAMFPKQPMTEAQRIAVTEKALDRAIETIQKQLKTGAVDPKKPVETTSPAIEAKRKTLEALNEQRQFIRDTKRLRGLIENAKKGEFKKRPEPKQRAAEIMALKKELRDLQLAAYRAELPQKRLETAIKTLNELQDQLQNNYRAMRKNKEVVPQDLADIREKISTLHKTIDVTDKITDFEEQIRTGEFKVPEVKPAKPEPVELQQKRAELRRLRKKWDAEIEALAPKSTKEKVLGAIGNIASAPRALTTTIDISATGRQGALLSARRPVVAAEAFKKGAQSFLKEADYDRIMEDIYRDPQYYLADKAKLHLSDVNGSVHAREEAFMSNWADRVPGVARSGRQMTAQLNWLRWQSFKQFLKKYPNATSEELQAYGDWLNAASGRGSLGDFESASKTLASVFFSARFQASRFQAPYKIIKYWKLPRVRNEIAKDMAAYVGLLGTMAGLGVLGGATIATDIRDPDWLKLRFGDTRIDFLAGFQQMARLVAREGLWATDKMGLTGKDLLESEKDENPLEILGQAATYKLAPGITIPIELISGENMIGQETTPMETLARSVVPMYVSSIREAYKNNEGDLVLAALAGLSEFVGFGASTYEDSQAKTRKKIRELKDGGKNEEADRLMTEWNLRHPDKMISSVNKTEDAKALEAFNKDFKSGLKKLAIPKSKVEEVLGPRKKAG